MIQLHPRRIDGCWKSGFSLDVHTVSSVYRGDNSYENTHSSLGDLVYRLKYRNDHSAVAEIVSAVVRLLKPQRSKFDLLVPVPPSKTRKVQPVILLAQRIGKALDLPVSTCCVVTTRTAVAMKDLDDQEERKRLIEGLYWADKKLSGGKRVLLFDDVYRSGTTMKAVTEELLTRGQASAVHALALTRTRNKR